MCKVSVLRALVVERLSAAAEEIFSAVEKMITEKKMQQTKEISTEQQRAAVQRRLSVVADEICKMLEVMVGECESKVFCSNMEAGPQLLEITVKTETELHRIDGPSRSDCDENVSFGQQSDGDTGVHKTSDLQQVEDASLWSDSELIHGETSHLQLTLKTENCTSAWIDTNKLKAEPLESDIMKPLNRRSEHGYSCVEENTWKDQTDRIQVKTESSDAESKESDNSDEGRESDEENWTRPITENHEPEVQVRQYPLRYGCNVCGRTFGSKASLVNHVKKEEWDKDICGVCGKDFETSQSLILHLQDYTCTYECEFCGKKCDGPSRLEVHIRRHTGEKPYMCSVCGKAFALKGNLKGHMRVHSVKKPYICSICWKVFTLEKTLMRHMKGHTKSSGNKNPKRATYMGQTYSCKVCGKSFSYRARFLKHVKEFENDKDICGVCGESFESEESLRLHLQTYTQTNDCEVCGKKCVGPKHLEMHMRKHTGEKPHTCNFCGKAFALKGNLKGHMRVHAVQKPYACSVCWKAFALQETLMRHMKGHKKVKSCICSVCGKNFRLTGGIRQGINLCGTCRKQQDFGGSLIMHATMKTGDGITLNVTDDYQTGYDEADGSNRPNRATNEDQSFTCKVCGRTFCYRGSFVKHVKEFEKDKNMCGVCGEHFESNQSLRLHLQTYTQTNDCEVCGKKCVGPRSLEMHMRKHTGEKPYMCSLCGKAFALKGNLKGHMKVHTGGNQGFAVSTRKSSR